MADVNKVVMPVFVVLVVAAMVDLLNVVLVADSEVVVAYLSVSGTEEINSEGEKVTKLMVGNILRVVPNGIIASYLGIDFRSVLNMPI